MPRWFWYLVNPFQALLCLLWTIASILTVGVALLFGARPTLALQAARHPWCTVILAICGARIERVGFPAQADDACLYVANHTTVFDIPVLVRSVEAPLYFIAKKELFGLPIFGWYLRKTNMVPVVRGARTAGLDLSRFARVDEACGVVAFPEGTRSRDGRLAPFKRGSFAAAIAAGIPVVPIAIEDATAVVGRLGLTGRPGTIRAHHCGKIDTSGMQPSDRAALAQRARAAIAEKLGEPDSATEIRGAVDVDDAAAREHARGVGQE